MNLLQIKTEVKRIVGRHDAQFDDRIMYAVNRAIVDWTRAFPWENLRTSGTVTARGGNTLVLPANVDRLIWLADKTNSASIAAGNRQWDRSDTYTYLQQTQGLAREWEAVGYVPTFTDVSGPLVFELMAAAGASSAVTAMVEGSLLFDSNAGDHSQTFGIENVGITNTSGVTTGTVWTSITNIYLTCPPPTAVKVKCGGNLVAAIQRGRRSVQYYKVRLHDKPATGTIFQYEAFTKPREIISDEESIPASVDKNYIMWSAASDIFTQLKEDERAAMAKARAARIARDVKAVEVQFGDWAGQIIPEDLA